MAKNHMADVAKILGVEIGERFAVVPWDNDDELFEFDAEYGLGSYLISQNSTQFGGHVDLFYSLVMGYEKIFKLPWKPKNGDRYYYPGVDCKRVLITSFGGDTADLALNALGMCYRTREEAEARFKEDYKKLTGKELGKNE